MILNRNRRLPLAVGMDLIRVHDALQLTTVGCRVQHTCGESARRTAESSASNGRIVHDSLERSGFWQKTGLRAPQDLPAVLPFKRAEAIEGEDTTSDLQPLDLLTL